MREHYRPRALAAASRPWTDKPDGNGWTAAATLSSSLEGHLFQLQPLHRRGLEAFDLLAHPVHVSRRVGDDARHRRIDDLLELQEKLFALGLIVGLAGGVEQLDRKSTRLNSSHLGI